MNELYSRQASLSLHRSNDGAFVFLEHQYATRSVWFGVPVQEADDPEAWQIVYSGRARVTIEHVSGWLVMLDHREANVKRRRPTDSKW